MTTIINAETINTSTGGQGQAYANGWIVAVTDRPASDPDAVWLDARSNPTDGTSPTYGQPVTLMTTTTVWLCDSCHLSLAGYSDDEMGYTPDREPLTLLCKGTLSHGLVPSEHATDCAVYLTGDWQHECECDHDSFSTSACDGCGDPLAGDRYGATHTA